MSRTVCACLPLPLLFADCMGPLLLWPICNCSAFSVLRHRGIGAVVASRHAMEARFSRCQWRRTFSGGFSSGGGGRPSPSLPTRPFPPSSSSATMPSPGSASTSHGRIPSLLALGRPSLSLPALCFLHSLWQPRRPQAACRPPIVASGFLYCVGWCWTGEHRASKVREKPGGFSGSSSTLRRSEEPSTYRRAATARLELQIVLDAPRKNDWIS